MEQEQEMSQYNRAELAEALRSIESTRKKCEKAIEKLRESSSQHTLTTRRIAAFRLAEELIAEKLMELEDLSVNTRGRLKENQFV
jgi:ribosomal protein L17